MTQPPAALIDASAIVARAREDLEAAARRRLFIAHRSPWIVEEATRAIVTLYCKRNGFTLEAQRRLSVASKVAMRRLTQAFVTVDPKPPYPSQWDGADPGDDHVCAAAIAARAAYVVSENTRDFPPVSPDSGKYEWQGIVHLTTSQFLALILD
jgi:hypothetical protein